MDILDVIYKFILANWEFITVDIVVGVGLSIGWTLWTIFMDIINSIFDFLWKKISGELEILSEEEESDILRRLDKVMHERNENRKY